MKDVRKVCLFSDNSLALRLLRKNLLEAQSPSCFTCLGKTEEPLQKECELERLNVLNEVIIN